MSEVTNRTGSFPAVTVERVPRPSPVPAPPAGTPERDAWVERELRVSRRDASLALDGIERIETSLGYSPDAARGVKEGAGLLGQLSVLIDMNTRREVNASNRRHVMIGISITLGIILSVFGVIRVVIEVIHAAQAPQVSAQPR